MIRPDVESTSGKLTLVHAMSALGTPCQGLPKIAARQSRQPAKAWWFPSHAHMYGILHLRPADDASAHGRPDNAHTAATACTSP